ncbi:cysteine--tRNA ligase [Chloracidobacterium sp. MS 40/45]|jgi:cysteinyl-tRNA synthetase|uniref:cysteine--tRNA ligase n=1 Tax=Chloracidobacterium aggregatum TaxID=2851959 RepID=UPI001B8D47C0|nr:cysteine--tRNA ligase [Chloracidobacterium aggregatum]QUW00544.1 cysteine--tRNA ligase [Chloracidobacterium sp. MS 40/45]
MSMHFFNSLTRQREPFVPLEGRRVRMYACGPTVYNFAHIGNFRTFVFVDILRRHLKWRGYELLHVMNLTDVDDKIIRDARAAGLPLREFTERYVTHFWKDADALDIERPEVTPRATDHIPEMVALIGRLLHCGCAYHSDGSTYFRIAAFPRYGALSGNKLAGNIAGGSARVEADEYEKDDVRDFVLWKRTQPDEPTWDSPLGPGRPGWHIECSAMAMKYLGESFDIHCGGVDLIFPHHENEIAQSEGATGKPFARYWLHAEHLLVDGRKMSKREGNYYTLRDLLDRGYQARAVRYVLAAVPYRKPLNFTLEGVEAAERRLKRLNETVRRLREAVPTTTNQVDETAQVVADIRQSFGAAMDDDLNTAEALAAVAQLETTVNIALSRGELTEAAKAAALAGFEDVQNVLGILDPAQPELLPADIEALIAERLAARKAKNFARADEIRAQLAAQGIILEDGKDGTRWRRA